MACPVARERLLQLVYGLWLSLHKCKPCNLWVACWGTDECFGIFYVIGSFWTDEFVVISRHFTASSMIMFLMAARWRILSCSCHFGHARFQLLWDSLLHKKEYFPPHSSLVPQLQYIIFYKSGLYALTFRIWNIIWTFGDCIQRAAQYNQIWIDNSVFWNATLLFIGVIKSSVFKGILFGRITLAILIWIIPFVRMFFSEKDIGTILVSRN